MFDFVRNHTRLVLGFMLLLIVPSFVFFGVQGYSRFTDASNANVATVDGQGISRAEWENAVKRYTDNIRAQSPNVDPKLLDSPQLRADTLDALVRERVLLTAADKMHLYPTATRMVRLFDADPQLAGFRGPDGKISRELLAAQGMTPEIFDQRLRQQFAVQQVLAGVTQTVQPPPAMASASLDPLLQRRELQLQRFDPAAYRSQVNPSEADIEAYYKSNEAQFQAPEQATIQYVVLDFDTLGKAASVTEADARKFYAENASRYTTPEERRASHILIKADKDMPAAERAKVRAKAEALLAQVRKSPGEFAALARKNSEDPGSAERGGDLDFIARGAMVKPFEDAVFSLKTGDISEIVETDFGYHIITVTGVRGGQVKPFEAVRAEIESELRKSYAQRHWAEAAEQFTNTVYEQSDSLDPVADKLKLEKRSATVQRTPAPDAVGPLASPKLLEAVFGNDALRNKRNTDAVEVGPNQLASARVLQYTPAHTLALAEVKDRVRESLVARESAALAKKEGQARLAAVRADPAAALPLAVTVSRAQPQGLPRSVLEAALRLEATKLPAATGVDLGAQGFVVVRVLKVLPRDTPAAEEPRLREQYAQTWAAAEAEAYLETLKKRYKAVVKIKPEAVAESASAAAAR